MAKAAGTGAQIEVSNAIRLAGRGAVTVLHPPVRTGEDIFTLDRVIDAAANSGIAVRVSGRRNRQRHGAWPLQFSDSL